MCVYIVRPFYSDVACVYGNLDGGCRQREAAPAFTAAVGKCSPTMVVIRGISRLNIFISTIRKKTCNVLRVLPNGSIHLRLKCTALASAPQGWFFDQGFTYYTTTLLNRLSMSISLADYRCKLIIKILFADSREKVLRYCDAAVKSLVLHKVHGFLIARFIDKVIIELRKFNPMNKNAQQWSNITMARVLLFRIRQQNCDKMK